MIPKNIFLAWDNPNNIPPYALKVFREIKEIMPNWNVQFYNDFSEMYSSNLFSNLIKTLPFNLENSKGFSKRFLKTLISDFFRLYLLKEYGGIWLDVDARVTKPFDYNIIDRDAFVSETNYNNVGNKLLRSNLDIFFMGSKKESDFINLIIYNLEKEIKDNKLNFFYPLSPTNVLERNSIVPLNSRTFTKNYYFDKLPIDFTNEVEEKDTKTKKEFTECLFEEFPLITSFYVKHYRITGGYGNNENIK